ncbi:hypothetical protein [Aeromicrobium sp. A1-2]|uniref:hypothetical protein n=1 Tax=Aeromicrobium sp. A1-2 TaxID=2107713 RepID=UPI001C1FF780|nr:hypothetical protein [Aeromicrobium sp. A1-2]
MVATGRSGRDRAALRDVLSQHRLAELREGIWLRPANLDRPAAYQAEPALNTFVARPDRDAAELAEHLWQLGDWSRRAHALEAQLRETTDPALRLTVAANLVRLLSTDPILPPALLPAQCPAESLRAAYGAYQGELRALAAN